MARHITKDEGFLGEHATLVNGKADDITEADLLAVGVAGGVCSRKGREVIGQIAAVTGALR